MNTKKAGDKGLGQAIAYYTGVELTVCVPLTDSQDYDLVVERNGVLRKVQVKYTSFMRNDSYEVSLSIKGGSNGSLIRKGTDIIFDELFVLAQNGDRWIIPRSGISNCARLGAKYNQYKV